MQLKSLLLTTSVSLSILLDRASATNHASFSRKSLNRLTRQEIVVPTHKVERNLAQDFRFLNDKTRPYVVESLPEVNFDLGEMYSGNIPIDIHNDSRSLFFIFQPTVGAPVDEITIWLNGGPGCSSLEGFFQENGRFLWQPGTYAPVENPYSWVNLTNMLWVDQPVGSGFSIGTPLASTEEEIAGEFVKFWKNFETLFGIKNYKIYITGESYAGRYVPYISAAFLDQNDTTYYDLGGALVYDPCIGQYDYIQEQVPIVPFVLQNKNLFGFNETLLAELESLHESCGYKAYIDEYLVFPAKKVQPPKFHDSSDGACDLWDLAWGEAFNLNPCFNDDEVNMMCPSPWDVLVVPDSSGHVYFDRDDVKRALHAPNITWEECGGIVFTDGQSGPELQGDLSANSIEKVLPQVIEATNRVLISNGDYDMNIITNGTLLSIQNMTWNGYLGFQSAPSEPIIIDLDNSFGSPHGQMGIQHYERGLLWAETYQSGHMQPQYQPQVSYCHLQWLLGRIDSL
ncbi:putative pheromone processing carboxypeptidase [Xylogone sp. PMI_703]|nr:putative pheromone processing carboxypeptidase [Xylogone sp. PMI_703]